MTLIQGTNTKTGSSYWHLNKILTLLFKYIAGQATVSCKCHVLPDFDLSFNQTTSINMTGGQVMVPRWRQGGRGGGVTMDWQWSCNGLTLVILHHHNPISVPRNYVRNCSQFRNVNWFIPANIKHVVKHVGPVFVFVWITVRMSEVWTPLAFLVRFQSK